jgi:hypothetical protein
MSVVIVNANETKLVVKPIASAADKPFFAFTGNAGINISVPGSMDGFFLNMKNLRFWFDTPLA